MAYIDKLHLADYNDFNKFRLWCLIHKPNLLYNFYNPFISYSEWTDIKESCYNTDLKNIEKEHEYYEDFNTAVEYEYKLCKEYGTQTRDPDLIRKQVSYHLSAYNQIKDKDSYMENCKLSVCNFSLKEDKYLLWHCPLKCIREYLEQQCGYKTKWYHKLFFKK